MKLASGKLVVSGDQWPMLVYANLEYDADDPWSGLFRSQILVWVNDSSHFFSHVIAFLT